MTIPEMGDLNLPEITSNMYDTGEALFVGGKILLGGGAIIAGLWLAYTLGVYVIGKIVTKVVGN